MEASAGTKCYGEEMGVDLFDHIDDLLEFPNDDELLLDMDHMVGSSGSVNECLLPIDVMPAAPKVEANFEPLLLSFPDDAFLSNTQGDTSNCSGLMKVGDALNGEEEHLGPCDELDMLQLEWLSNFFDEAPSASSFPVDNSIITAKTPNTTTPEPKKVECTITIPTPTLALGAPNDIPKEDPNLLFCTSSPVSVLEQTSYSGGSSASSSVSSSSSFSSSNSFSRASLSPRSVTPPEPNFAIPARPRSKRSRPASFSPRNHVIVPLLPPSSETQPIIESMAESDSVPVSVPIKVSVPVPMPVLPSVQVPAPVMPLAKKKKKVAKRVSYGDNEEAEWGEFRPQATAVRRCMHCQIEKTPQWRAGPMGPKTLCNACGVRYKSGRLFPEYRPAASPTFVPTIHSNSHKKVVEMRLKATESTDTGSNLLHLIRRKRE